MLLEETERNLNSLRELKKIGISIALDDFGVGYSSLAYLTKFPFDKVKIDKSFVDALDRTETSAVISSIVELAKSLNLAIIAEGIETEDQRKRVRSLGIKFGQGFPVRRAGASQPPHVQPDALGCQAYSGIAYAADAQYGGRSARRYPSVVLPMADVRLHLGDRR